MLMVVAHHCMPRGYSGPGWLADLLECLQYPALACFFLTGGFLAFGHGGEGWRDYLKRRFVRLMVPFFAVNLLTLIPRYVTARLLGVRPNITLSWLVLSFLDPHSKGISPHLWFLMAAFLCALLLPLFESVIRRGPHARRICILALMGFSALPVRLPTLFCLDELKLYACWYVLGLAMACAGGEGRWPLRRGWVAAAGLIAFGGCVLLAGRFVSPTLCALSGGAAVLWLCGKLKVPNLLTERFARQTYVIYLLSMGVQNLMEAIGYSLGWPWYLMAVAMFTAGLCVPCGVYRLNRWRPFPRAVRIMLGL